MSRTSFWQLGRWRISARCFFSVLVDIFFLSKAAFKLRMAKTPSWLVKPFVEATLISGPASIGMTRSLSLAIELSETLTIEIIFSTFPRQYLSAANVSAVSPDWLTNMARVFLLIGGLRYRNSDAISTSTGILATCSNQYLAVRHA